MHVPSSAAMMLACALTLGSCSSTTAPQAPPADGPRIMLRDAETGSFWNARGQAIAGRLLGAQLEPVASSHTAYWFAWASFWPETSVWGDAEAGAAYDGIDIAGLERWEIVPDESPDSIPPLESPAGLYGEAQFEPAQAVSLADDDIVLGLALDGEARAYPLQIMIQHEIAMHELASLNVLVTYCPLSASGMAFERGDNWFGNTGAVYNNNLLLYDRRTRSLWSQMGRLSINGERTRETLNMLPLYQGTWSAWLERYPETQVLSRDTGYGFRDYDANDYRDRGYHTSQDIWFPQKPGLDDRFHPKARVLGIIGATTVRAYPVERLAAELGPAGVINDTFEDQPIVLVYDHRAGTATPFSRHIDGRELTFTIVTP